MNFWIDLFTGTTWKEFHDAGGNISGFRYPMRNMVHKIEQGDILLCYLTGVMRWVGALRVIGPSNNKAKIWKDKDFPIRLEVETLIALSPEHGIPMKDLKGKVAFYLNDNDEGKFKGFVRRSPRKFEKREDGQLIFQLLSEAKKQPVSRPVDQRKLNRIPLFHTDERKGRKKSSTVVSVPESDRELPSKEIVTESDTLDKTATRHTEIQYQLLHLGNEMGYDLWVARNDRGRIWNNQTLGDMPRVIDSLPTQFNEATTRTIEMIDVLWLQGNSIAAAFEVESTTSIYSGLLRMSDLLALQPNLTIDLYLVAPDERRSKVEQEILRPTFKLRTKPLSRICGFIGFNDLGEKIKAIHKLGLAKSLKPDFLHTIAEYFGNEDESNK